MSYQILVINPGSTSTKLGVFEDDALLFSETLRHSTEELKPYATIPDQLSFRKDVILSALQQHDLDLSKLSAVAGRGGAVRPLASGTYRIDEALLRDCMDLRLGGKHASGLGAPIAHEIAAGLDIPSFVVDPTVVDELQPAARYSGHPLLPRHSIFHALNQKAVAKRYAAESGKKYEELRLIVCHMGGGISVGAHLHGRVVDVQNSLNGDGPFSPERTGTVPAGQLAELCFSGRYTLQEVQKLIAGRGGMVAYTGTTDMVELTKRAKTEPEIAEIMDAFHYQIAKEIGAMAAALEGQVDAILLTGGIAYGQETVEALKKRIGWIAPVVVYPGEDELLALAQGTLRVLRGQEEAKTYQENLVHRQDLEQLEQN